MRRNKSSQKKSLLRVGGLLILASLVASAAITKYSQPPMSDREKAQLYWQTQPWVTPSPWTEIDRVTNPDGEIDSVLVTGEPRDRNMLCTTSLFLVPRGSSIRNEGPHKMGWSRDRIEKLHRDSPLIVFEAKELSMLWKDSLTIEISGRVTEIFAQSASKTIQVNGLERSVRLAYALDEE